MTPRRERIICALGAFLGSLLALMGFTARVANFGSGGELIPLWGYASGYLGVGVAVLSIDLLILSLRRSKTPPTKVMRHEHIRGPIPRERSEGCEK